MIHCSLSFMIIFVEMIFEESLRDDSPHSDPEINDVIMSLLLLLKRINVLAVEVDIV